MKKIAALVMAMLMVTCLFAGCAKKEAANDDLSYVKDKGTLVIGITEYAPMNYYDDSGKLIGFDTEFAEAVCEKLGVAPEFTVIDWNTKEVELKAKNIDCIWNGFTMNGREDDYTWTPAYINNTQVFAVNKNSGIKKAADLAGKNVLVQADSSALAALQDEENTDIKALADSFGSLTQVPDYESALMELEAGSADAVAMDEGVALTKQAQNDNIVILDDVISQEQYGIAFKKGNDELRDQVWSTLLEMEKDGTVDKIAAKYPSINTANICISDNE